MASLLVSVRSAHEACLAIGAGAAIIDVKEPLEGALGRACATTWRAIRDVVPAQVPLSLALGELGEFADFERETLAELSRIAPAPAYLKLGLAGAGPRWRERLRAIREAARQAGVRSAWVAVVYLDWSAVDAPEPADVVAHALELRDCPGVLFDTGSKVSACVLGDALPALASAIRGGGRFVAAAGGLALGGLARARVLDPDVIAVRGAACQGGDRTAAIDPRRVRQLVAEAARLDAPGRPPRTHTGGARAAKADHTRNQ